MVGFLLSVPRLILLGHLVIADALVIIQAHKSIHDELKGFIWGLAFWG